MNSRLRVLALAPFALAAAVGCGDDSSSQVPVRAPAQAPATANGPAAANDPAAAPAPTPTPAQTTGVAIGAPLAIEALADAVLGLKLPADRASVFVTTTDNQLFQLVVPPDADATYAPALARALGSVSTTTLAWPPATPPLAVKLLAVRGGAPIREQPNTRAHEVGALPDGAFFIALEGSITTPAGAQVSGAEWKYGLDSRHRIGWIQGTQVAAEEGCVLPHDAIAGALGLRVDDPTIDAALLGNMHVHRGGQSHRGSFVIGSDFAAVLTRPANCNHAAVDTRIDLDLPVEEFHHAVDRDQGETFVAIASEPQNGADESTWSFYPPHATEPALTQSLATNWTVPSNRRVKVRVGVHRGPANARGYWAFSIQAHGEDATFYTSDGTTFSEVVVAVGAAP